MCVIMHVWDYRSFQQDRSLSVCVCSEGCVLRWGMVRQQQAVIDALICLSGFGWGAWGWGWDGKLLMGQTPRLDKGNPAQCSMSTAPPKYTHKMPFNLIDFCWNNETPCCFGVRLLMPLSALPGTAAQHPRIPMLIAIAAYLKPVTRSELDGTR